MGGAKSLDPLPARVKGGRRTACGQGLSRGARCGLEWRSARQQQFLTADPTLD
jgi:hypothetical protein